jgi:hypothetical protein
MVLKKLEDNWHPNHPNMMLIAQFLTAVKKQKNKIKFLLLSK